MSLRASYFEKKSEARDGQTEGVRSPGATLDLLNIYKSLFILSGHWAYLLGNAMSYDGEILQADAYRPYAKHLLGFISRPY